MKNLETKDTLITTLGNLAMFHKLRENTLRYKRYIDNFAHKKIEMVTNDPTRREAYLKYYNEQKRKE